MFKAGAGKCLVSVALYFYFVEYCCTDSVSMIHVLWVFFKKYSLKPAKFQEP